MSQPRKSSRTWRAAASVAAAVAVAAPLLASVASPSASALVASDHDNELRDSPYGLLRYDDTAGCGKNVEVAYVADRIIVQTDQPWRVANWISGWLAAQTTSASGSAKHGLTSNPDNGEVLVVDTIHFGEHGHGSIKDVHAFDLPGAGPHDVVGLSRYLVNVQGLAAAPDYVLRPSGHVFYMPESLPVPTDAEPVSNSPLTPKGPERGDGGRVAVFDTGLSTDVDLGPNVRAMTSSDFEVPDVDLDGDAEHPFKGHGAGVASVLDQLVPGADIEVAKTFEEGVSTEFSSAQRIATALDGLGAGELPHLVVAAFGTEACDNSGLPGDSLMPVALRAATDFVEQLSSQQHAGIAIVAAAGNDADRRREYPAAFDSVIAVGALDATLDDDGDAFTAAARTAPIAEFSGRGRWVTAYAPGEALLTHHVGDPKPVDFAPFVDPTNPQLRTIVNGQARISGTSFAAPVVGAAILETMAVTGLGVRDAWAQLEAAADPPQAGCDGTLPGNPSAVAIVLGDRDSAFTDPALATAEDLCSG